MKIICYGDSNTWGYDPRNYFGGRCDNPWPEILGELSGWDVVNQGENGREIPYLIPTFPQDTDLLIIMLGTNDLLQSNSVEVICWRMERLLTSLEMEPAKILLLSPPPMVFGDWVRDQKLIERSASLAECYRKLALRLGTGFMDSREWNIPMSFDGVHMTQDGHHTIASELYRYLTKDSMR